MRATSLAVGAVIAIQSISTGAILEYDLLELPAPLQEPVFIDKVTGISDRGEVAVTLTIVEQALPAPWYRHVRYEAGLYDGRSWQTLYPTGAHLTVSIGFARGRLLLANAYFDGLPYFDGSPSYNSRPFILQNGKAQRVLRQPLRFSNVQLTQANKRGDLAGKYFGRGLYTNLWGRVTPVDIPNWFFLRRGRQQVDLAAVSRGQVRNALINSRGEVLMTCVASNATPSGPEMTRLVWLRRKKVEEQPVPANWKTFPTLLATNSFVGAFSMITNSMTWAFGMFRSHNGTFTVLNATNEIMTISGINDTGDFVGHSIHIGYTNYSAQVRGFVHRNGTRTDLAEAVSGASEWEPLLPEAINNKGEIACVGVRKGQERASVVLLLPRVR